eukprot:COSAG03_NODE_210_length_10594_cov_32.990472_12_plen_326_part_00
MRAGAVVRGRARVEPEPWAAVHTLMGCLWLLRGGAEVNYNIDFPVFGAADDVKESCEEHTDACTDYADTCIDCSATGSVESDPYTCTHDESACTCPDGCVVNGETVGGSQDDITDEAGCDAVQGTWIAEGDALPGCTARGDVTDALYFGDGTEAAALVCGVLGEGTGNDQCEGSDALARLKGYISACTAGDYACPTTEEIAKLGCEWSSDTSTCVPNAALTTLLTEAWTRSKAAGFLSSLQASGDQCATDQAACDSNTDCAALLPDDGYPDENACSADTLCAALWTCRAGSPPSGGLKAAASGAGASVPSVIAAAVALFGGLLAL